MRNRILLFIFLIILISSSGCRGRCVNGKQTFQTEEGPVHYYIEIITINSGPSLGMRKLFTWIRSYLYIEQNGKKKKFKIHLFNETGGWAFAISNKPKDWCHMEKTHEKGIYRLYIGLALRESVFIVDTINDEVTETDELFYAVSRIDIEAVKKRLEMDDVNKVIYTQNTALHRASSQGYNEIVKLLLEKGADAEIKDQHGMTPLNRAAQRNQLTAIILLLDSGAKISGGFPETSWTPLFNSVFRRHYEACEILLKRGADPNIKDEKGRTPLDIAIAERTDLEGDIRRQNEFDKIIDLLKEYGAKDTLFSAVGRNDVAAVSNFINKENVNLKENPSKDSSLHQAAAYGYNEIIQILLSNDADINIKDELGRTPLMIAVGARQLETVSLLINSGANIESVDSNKQTALFHSLYYKSSPEACEILLKAGANPNVKDNEGICPLKTAIDNKKAFGGNAGSDESYSRIIDLLKEYGDKNEE